MTLKRGKIHRSLLNKGFVEEIKTKHLRYRFYHNNERTDIHTTVSRGTDNYDISDALLSEMAKQCYLSGGNFRRLIECSVSENDYYNLVKERIVAPKDVS